MLLLTGGDSDEFWAERNLPKISVVSEAYSQDPKPIYTFEVLTLPLKRAGNLLLVEAKVDSVVGDFIFDTGAASLVLNKMYFPSARKVSATQASGITGAMGYQQEVEVGELRIKGLSFKKFTADAADLSHLENIRGRQIMGLLGLDLFTEFEVEIDLPQGVIRLIRCDKKGEPALAMQGVCSLSGKLQFAGTGAFTRVYVAEKPMMFCIDTGAEINVLDNRASKKVLEQLKISGRSSMAGSGSQRTEIFYGALSGMRVGEVQMAPMQTALMRLDHMSAAYGMQVDGMLGYEFLKQGVLRLNFRKGELRMCLIDNLDMK